MFIKTDFKFKFLHGEFITAENKGNQKQTDNEKNLPFYTIETHFTSSISFPADCLLHSNTDSISKYFLLCFKLECGCK